jgi:site-specific DNA-methyltransferase (adenine-specific)
VKALYFGDNLGVLRNDIKDESVDLIYLDPPFNSNATYNVLFKSPKGHQSDAQIAAFDDTWHWGPHAEAAFAEVMQQGNTDVAEVIRALRSVLGENDMMAYLSMMAVRLVELHRVLKSTGSLYLHCDPTASHYLKIVLDQVFGQENFRSEIIWRRTASKGLAFNGYPKNHDTLLYYVRGEQATFNRPYISYDAANLDEKTGGKYKHRTPDGRIYRLSDLTNPNPDRPNLTYEFLGVTKVWRWTRDRMQKAYDAGLVVQTKPGTVPQLKRFLDEQEGRPIDTVWNDIPPINSQAQERLGYPTQKPLALLERIITTSSNEGDVVLDPFCGCGTAVHASEKLKRQWIGIDVTHLAISLIEKRLRDAFPGITFEVHGTPKDLDGARDLAMREKYDFQYWACALINAQPYQGKKKGADSGIDGLIFFQDDDTLPKKSVVSVKGGENISVAMIRDFAHVIDREKASIGFFITLTPPTKPMVKEAAGLGFYTSPNGQSYQRLQILTIEGLLSGKDRAEYPLSGGGGITLFKKAKAEDTKTQTKLF